MIFKNSIIFIKERFPLYITIPLSVILYLSPAAGHLDIIYLLTGIPTVFLILLIIRFVDDYSDMDIDRIKDPSRSLVKGTIQLPKIKQEMRILFVFTLLLQFTSIYNLIIFLSVTILYLAFFKFKSRITVFLYPWIVNLYFLIIPAYVTIIFDFQTFSTFIIWGIFYYVAVVAHDYGHSIRRKLPDEKLPDLGTVINPGILSFTSLLLFLIDSIAGIVIFKMKGSWPFLMTLCLMMIILFPLLIKLVIDPSEKQAKKIYIPGFLFFIMPSLAYLIESLILK